MSAFILSHPTIKLNIVRPPSRPDTNSFNSDQFLPIDREKSNPPLSIFNRLIPDSINEIDTLTKSFIKLRIRRPLFQSSIPTLIKTPTLRAQSSQSSDLTPNFQRGLILGISDPQPGISIPGPPNVLELETLPPVSKRQVNGWYSYNNSIVRWDGQRLRCEHSKVRAECRECKGSGICEHNKKRSRCKECKGRDLCEHTKVKRLCKDCNGIDICKHSRRKSECKECNGTTFCEHSKKRNRCRDCGGSQFCEHDRRKSICKDCKGGSICEHNKIRSGCKDCKGGSVCEHNKIRSRCKDCKGGEICEHDRNRNQCKDCYTHPHNFCPICTDARIYKRSRTYPLCYRCYCLSNPDEKMPSRYKMKEHYLRDYIGAYCPSYNFVYDQIIEGGCSRRKPDILLDCLTHSIVIEIDENQHEDYKCEDKRIMQIFMDLGCRPLVVMRFNPDRYVDIDGKTINGLFVFDERNVIQITNAMEMHQRIGTLTGRIHYHFSTIPQKEVTIEKLFYSQIPAPKPNL